MLAVILFTPLLIALYICIRLFIKSFNAPKTLMKKYKEMGNPVGKSYEQIVSYLGKPYSRTNASDGEYEIIWLKQGAGTLQINMLFDKNSICIDCEDSSNGIFTN